MSQKNAEKCTAVQPAGKPPAEKQPSNHSPFYISRSLFQNRRLKNRQRLRHTKWATRREKQTERNRSKYTALVADVTIDLLSEDDNDKEEEEEEETTTTSAGEPKLLESIILTSDSEDEAASPVPAAGETVCIASKIFPMLPDETTVHTEIGNRIYHLSLTKLREGLASGSGGEEQQPNGKRKRGHRKTTPQTAPAPEPIPINLSSDLSISLISDEEDEYTHANKFPPATSQKGPDQHNSIKVGNLPKRRKLG